MEIILGIISGMFTAIGLGGGTILILLLTMGLKIPQPMAQAANLIFFIPTSITAIIVNIKNNNIDFKVGVNIAVYGIIGATMGAVYSSKIQVQNLRKIFGIFLLFVGIYETYSFYHLYIKKKNTNNKVEKAKEVGKNETN